MVVNSVRGYCVEGSVIVVVVHISVDYDYWVPTVEDCVGDDCTYWWAANHIVSVDISAEQTVVEVVWVAVVVNWTNSWRDIHVMAKVVVIRVNIWYWFWTVVVTVCHWSWLWLSMSLCVVTAL